ncbi:hypothetical protein M3J09_005629 [Ascochyta lentis]
MCRNLTGVTAPVHGYESSMASLASRRACMFPCLSTLVRKPSRRNYRDSREWGREGGMGI